MPLIEGISVNRRTCPEAQKQGINRPRRDVRTFMIGLMNISFILREQIRENMTWLRKVCMIYRVRCIRSYVPQKIDRTTGILIMLFYLFSRSIPKPVLHQRDMIDGVSPGFCYAGLAIALERSGWAHEKAQPRSDRVSIQQRAK